MKERRIHWAVVVALLSVTAYAVADEVTLTTYYPSPRGVYDQLQARDYRDFDNPTTHVDPSGTSQLTNLGVTGIINNPTGGDLIITNPAGVQINAGDTSGNEIILRGKVTGKNVANTKTFFSVGSASGWTRFDIRGKFRVDSEIPGAPNPILDVTSNQLRAVNGKLIVQPGTGVEVNGNMRTNGNADINGKLEVNSLLSQGTLTVNGETNLNDDVNINGKLDVCCVGAHISGGLDAEGSKNFVQPHPFDPTRELVYTSLEGREVRIYFDGVARLQDGEATIRVPEDFRLVSVPENLNVVVTPFGQARSLFVAERSLDRIVVRSPEGGSGEFGYLVMATRMGFEEARPVQENVHFRPDGRFTPEQMEARMAMPEQGPYYAKLSRTLTRRLLMQNGLMTPDGKLNRELVQRLGWEYREEDLAEATSTTEGTSRHERAPAIDSR